MPIDAGAIPLVGIVLMLMFGGKKKKRPAVSCPPFEWQGEQVDLAISAGIESGICTVGELTANVADAVYPKAPDGKTVAWPKDTPWVPPKTADDAAACLWDEIEDRVRARLEALPPDACVPAVDPAEVIRPFIARPGDPRPGTFYRIQKGDNITAIARKVSGLRSGHPLVAPTIRCITSSDWNDEFYGTPWDSANKLFPKYTAVMKDNQFRVIGKAFLPRHQNAVSEMYSGRMPERTIDNTKAGNKLGVSGANSYGTLWIPVLRIQDDTLICPEGNWADGRPKTEPPPEVIEALS
jgi:hypothetical protein